MNMKIFCCVYVDDCLRAKLTLREVKFFLNSFAFVASRVDWCVS